ncbi:MAG: PQQ-binding-like beta-propeller repeat protein [Planctomycetota bacterium]
MTSRLFVACQRLLAGLSLFALTASADAADWPQHLGPTQDAVSAETGLLDQWPAAGPPELWRHDVGIGFAGTAVVDGKVFLNDRESGVKDILRVLDLDSGEELWRYEHDAPGRVNFPGSRSTPCVTDTHVFLNGAISDVHAINLKTRKPDWSLNMWEKYPDQSQVFGYGTSPVFVDGLLLLCPTAPEDPVVIAVDPKTGETVWESQAKLNTNQTHHTPVVRTIAGVRAISMRDRTSVYFIDIKTGKTIWSVEVYQIKNGPHVTIPPVTVIGKNNQYVFVTNGYEDGSVLLEVKPEPRREQLFSIEQYRIPEGSQVHPAVYFDKHFYVNINENANLRGRSKTGGLACFDANNGEMLWHTKTEPNLNRGAITLADGKLYVFDGDTGHLMLVKPNPEKFDLISKFVALKGEGRSNNAWSPIVISDGRLIIRDHRQIVCFDLREKKAQK